MIIITFLFYGTKKSPQDRELKYSIYRPPSAIGGYRLFSQFIARVRVVAVVLISLIVYSIMFFLKFLNFSPLYMTENLCLNDTTIILYFLNCISLSSTLQNG